MRAFEAAGGEALSSSLEVDAGNGSVTIADAHFLFQADFKRAGSDLILTGDGQRVVGPGYFKHENLPTLLTAKGAALSGDIVAALAGPLAPGQYAQAGGAPATSDAQPIGRVATASGNATAVRNGVAVAGADEKSGAVAGDRHAARSGILFLAFRLNDQFSGRRPR